MKNLFALTILRIINLQFGSRIGMNPNYISLQNSKGNTIYVEKTDNSVKISAHKVSKQCLSIEITDENEIEDVATSIKGKLNIT